MSGAGPVLEAVAVVEIEAISRGYVVLDALAKRAAVTVRWAKALTPGKFVILFGGPVADTEEAMEAAQEFAGSLLIDALLLPYAHRDLLAAADGRSAPAPGDAIGVVETTTVASCLAAADAALKTTDVGVLRMHLALNIGGKGYFNLAGDLADVDAALESARAAVTDDKIIGIERIAQPHAEVRGHFSG